MNPYDPEKAQGAARRKRASRRRSNVTLTLPPPPYARQGGEIIAAELAKVGVNAKIENVEWAQWLSGVYKGKNYDLTIISHVEPLDIGIYANPNYYFRLRLARRSRTIYHKLTRRADPRRTRLKLLGEAQRQLADGQRQRLPVPAAAGRRSPKKKLKGLWSNSPIFANDLAALPGNDPARQDGQSAVHAAFACRPPSCSTSTGATLAVAGRGDARGARARSSAWEPHLHATYALDPERALEAGARPREARWRRRASRSARSTACRSRSRRTSRRGATRCRSARRRPSWSPAAADAPPAARLREAGAVILGKTTMPDYGMLSSGLSSFHPLARNPWDLDRNPGGSSAGAGAAAAAGLRAAARRHRHRRLGAPAGRLVRHLRPQAEPRPRSRSIRPTSAASPAR